MLALGLLSSAFSSTCSDLNVVQNVGYTANSKFYALHRNETLESCCALCSPDAKCKAFTIHASGMCTLAAQITVNTDVAAGTYSGRKAGVPVPGPSPAPKPPAPPTQCAPSAPSKKAPVDAPNIVLVLCDDLDLQLGGLTPLAKARAVLGGGGATATKWFIHTPVCCPSRAELLTGRYFHNLRVANNADGGCMHIDVNKNGIGGRFYDDYYFGTHLQQAGYTVGIFGKHLNNGNPKCPPPGIDRWMGNGGGNYHNPSFSVASAGDEDGGHTESWKNCSYGAASWGSDCYSTSVIGNASIAWMDEVGKMAPAVQKPFFAYVAVKAPHIQDGAGWPVTIPAPWYENAFAPDLQAPRTENWNQTYADHHWLIRQQPPMTLEQANKSDALYRTRWQSLLSVDDLIIAVVDKMAEATEMNGRKGYVIFTSDHGYRFGQFRMPQGKWNVYENDISIPWLIMGPGIAANTTFSHIASQVDTIPTILGLAGAVVPPSMDGRSIAAVLINGDLGGEEIPSTVRAHVQRARDEVSATHGNETSAAAAWRTELLIEYYGLGPVVRYEHIEDTPNNTFRALRVYDESLPAGHRNVKLVQFTDYDNWNFSAPISGATAYPYEWELFDIDADPFETKNLYATAETTWRNGLFATLERLYKCQGTTCN